MGREGGATPVVVRSLESDQEGHYSQGAVQDLQLLHGGGPGELARGDEGDAAA